MAGRCNFHACVGLHSLQPPDVIPLATSAKRDECAFWRRSRDRKLSTPLDGGAIDMHVASGSPTGCTPNSCCRNSARAGTVLCCAVLCTLQLVGWMQEERQSRIAGSAEAMDPEVRYVATWGHVAARRCPAWGARPGTARCSAVRLVLDHPLTQQDY